MKKGFVTVALAAVLSLGMAVHISAAQNNPVEVTADVLEYESASGKITANGGVKMVQDGAVMTGASVEYNTKTKESYLTGGVHIVKEDATLTAAEVKGYENTHFVASGNAVLVKGDSTLTGSLVDYYSDKQYAVVPEAARLTMPDGVMTAVRIESYINENRAVATGDVHIVSDVRQLDATSDNAVYYGGQDGKQGKAVLTGHAYAVQQGNVLTGETLTIHLDDKTMDAQGRTKLVVTPQ